MKKFSILELIGQTPLLKLDLLSGAKTNLFAKLEFTLPSGSIKDRAAYQIIKDAYNSGELVKGQTVVEMTSGNIGAGLALVCKQFGNPFFAFMSKGNSPERTKLLKALGANVVLTEQADGIPGKVTGKDIALASDLAEKYAKENNCYYVNQFHNCSGVKAHYVSTGPEIYNDLPEIDAFVGSIGTAGTFIGISKFLKEKKPDVKCIAVESENAAIINNGKVNNAKHIIQGTSYGLIPPHWQEEMCDEIVTVSDREVLEMTRRLSKEQGVYVGYSSGANVVASLKYAQINPECKNIATILCDTGFKYSDL